MRLRWAATILLAGCVLLAAGLWRPSRHHSILGQLPRPLRTAVVPALDEQVQFVEEEIPATGPGGFTGATSGGPMLGGAGTGRLKRFRVAVESNLAAELEDLTAAVDLTLGDPRGWTAGGEHRFQRVPFTADAEFTVYLVTRETAYRMCRVNGVDIRVDGVPYTSCRQVGKVVINLDRWRLSVPFYVDSKVTLSDYRAYVINHEVGHELGHGHEGCPGQGRPAPVMLTQTLGLQGCTANSWPYVDGRRYTGPPAA